MRSVEGEDKGGIEGREGGGNDVTTFYLKEKDQGYIKIILKNNIHLEPMQRVLLNLARLYLQEFGGLSF